MNINNKLFFDGIKFSSKRKKNMRTFYSTIFSILAALLVALLVATMLGYNPLEVGSKLFTVGIQNYKELVNFAGALVLSGLAFAMTAKAGIFNIGISGQMLGSGTCMVFVIMLFNKLGITDQIPNGAGQVIIVLIAMLVGALFALIVGALEVYLKVNSVVSAILLNWIIYFVSFYLIATFAANKTDDGQLLGSILIPDNFRLIDTQWGTGGLIPIVTIVVIISIAMFVLFKCTVFGHKITAVGLNKDASQYAGYKVNKIKLTTFALSGCISGILACVVYTTSIVPSIPLNLNVDAVPTEGFEGIAISLIANNNPIAIIFIGALFALFKNSMPGIAIPPSYFNVLIGLIMIGATISVLLLKWKPIQFWKTFKYGKGYYGVKSTYDNSLNILISKYKSILKWEKQNIYNQKISSSQKAILWSQTKQEIAEDYKTEKMMIQDEYQQSLWKLVIDNKLIHEEQYKTEMNHYVNDISLKSTKKITHLKEKNYQYQMKLINVEGKKKILLQGKIDANEAKIWLRKQINVIKGNEIEAILKIKHENTSSSIKSKLTKDIKTKSAAEISTVKVQAINMYKAALWKQSQALDELKQSKKKDTPVTIDNQTNADASTSNKLNKKIEVAKTDYVALKDKITSTSKYLNELATIENTQAVQELAIKYGSEENKDYQFDKAEIDAATSYEMGLNNVDSNKLIASINYKFHETDENGIGEHSNRLIKQIAKWSMKNVKKQYKHAVINIKAHRAISACKVPLEQQAQENFNKKAESIKKEVSKISNERIKPNVINYLDGLIQSKGITLQEGGNE